MKKNFLFGAIFFSSFIIGCALPPPAGASLSEPKKESKHNQNAGYLLMAAAVEAPPDGPKPTSIKGIQTVPPIGGAHTPAEKKNTKSTKKKPSRKPAAVPPPDGATVPAEKKDNVLRENIKAINKSMKKHGTSAMIPAAAPPPADPDTSSKPASPKITPTDNP